MIPPVLKIDVGACLSPFPSNRYAYMRATRYLSQHLAAMQCQPYDKRYASNIYRNYRGQAKVPLECLNQFKADVRDAHRGAIETLKVAFQKEGCRRLIPENYIPVVLTEANLQLVMELSGLRNEDIMKRSGDLPFLKVPAGILTCLHGKQRFEAAHQTLKGTDRWWTVELFVDGMSPSSLVAILIRIRWRL